jgi:predicted dehydrogenase
MPRITDDSRERKDAGSGDVIVTIAMNGVTGRMGRNQHLERSIVAIRDAGGLVRSAGGRIHVRPILVGRNEAKLRDLASTYEVSDISTDLAATLADDSVDVYFDAQTTNCRADAVRLAIDAGKHVYCEKPLSDQAATARELAVAASKAGIKAGIVQDKLFLPGLVKLRRLLDSGFFGRILSVRIEFGYWVFEGHDEPAQRPSWNYRAAEGGGIVLDMFPHWQYVVEELFGTIESVVVLATTHVPERIDEAGAAYAATADDAAYGIMQLDNGVVVQVNSSWTTRVRRDELVTFHVDGTGGSAVAGLRDCVQQHRSATPRPVWNPDIPNPIDFRATWLDVPSTREYENGFREQWERYLRHVVDDEPFPWTFERATRGTDLVAAALRSSAERRWVRLDEVQT